MGSIDNTFSRFFDLNNQVLDYFRLTYYDLQELIEESKLNFYNKLNTFSDKHFLNALSDLKQESHKLTINFPDQKKAIDQLLLEMKECFNSLIDNHYIDIENIKGIKTKIDQQIEDLKTFF